MNNLKNSESLLVSNNIWKDVDGFEGIYVVSTNAIVKGVKRSVVCSDGRLFSYEEKFLTARINRAGYVTVCLTKNKETLTAHVHRLVAKAFVPNPQDKPYVNHKNGVKTDNTIENLEWVTHKENVQHAFDTGLNRGKGATHPNATRVKNICTGEQWDTINDAAKATGVKPNVLRYRLSRNSLKCFRKFKYKQIEEVWTIGLN